MIYSTRSFKKAATNFHRPANRRKRPPEYKPARLFRIVSVLALSLFVSCTGHWGKLDRWRIETVPSGNTFYEPVDREDVIPEIKRLLSSHRDRFNFDGRIKKLRETAPAPGRGFRFAVLGDSRSNPELWHALVRHMGTLDPAPDFVINTGDVVEDGLPGQYLDYYIPPLLKTDIPFFIAIGNHDMGYNKETLEFRYLFGEDALDYFFDYGNTRFVFFDNVTGIRPYEEKWKWLEGVLESTPKGFPIIVSAHRPPGNIEKWAWHGMRPGPSPAFTRLMTRYGVAHVFLGHIHAYSTARFENVDYTVTGGGGASLYPLYGPGGNFHHYIICDVMPDRTIRQTVVRFKRKPLN